MSLTIANWYDARRGYWGTDFPAALAPTAEEIANAARVLCDDYAANPLGSHPGYDDAARNQPLPAGRNRMAAREILNLRRAVEPRMNANRHESGTSYSDSDSHPAGEGCRMRAERFTRGFSSGISRFVFIGVHSWFFKCSFSAEGRPYAGYFSAPLNEIAALYRDLADGRWP